MASSKEKAARIRELNDALRRTFAGGQVVMTAGVDALPADVKAEVFAKVRSFEAFDADNDPWGEHDFGSFKVGGETFFFKLDYYSPDLEGASEDPSDPAKTARVLTIMGASEY